MNKHPHGYCVIINNIHFQDKNIADLKGAEEDEKRLKILFRALKFDVIVRRDLNKHEIEGAAETYGGKNHRDFDAFLLILMSHGGDRDHILRVDGRETTMKNLMVEFQANKCPSLKGKPKVLIIQTCRGLIKNTTETFLSSIESINAVSAQMDNSPFARPFSPDSTLPIARSEFPPEADFLLAFATVPGYVAFRSPESGTFFIQVCLSMFLLYAQHISELEG